MKRFWVFVIGLAFVFTASASAQPPAPPTVKDAAPAKVQVAPVTAKEKKDLKKKKEMRMEKPGEAGLKAVVR
jgi:hypothetical protein